VYGDMGLMVVTVAEWDARGKWEDLAEQACGNVDYWRDEFVKVEAKLAERDAAIAELKQRLAATEDFTRQYADSVMARNAKPDSVTPRADPYRALLTVAEPTHLLGGDKAR
jgi:hypothetical protein